MIAGVLYRLAKLGASVFYAQGYVIPDVSAPVLTDPTGIVIGLGDVRGSVITNKGGGTLYFAVSAAASLTPAQVKAGMQQAVTRAGIQTVVLPELQPATSYYLYFLHTGANGIDSDVSRSPAFVTLTVRLVSITQDDLMTAIRTFLLTLVDQPVLRTPINRAAMPKGAFIAMSPGRVTALATNTVKGTRSVKRSSQFECQLDCYGDKSGDTATMISMLFRDQYAIEVFEQQPFEIVPLYAEDAQQMPVVTGEEQYLERWTFEIVLQFNPVVSMPAQSANMLELSLRNVDRTFPP